LEARQAASPIAELLASVSACKAESEKLNAENTRIEGENSRIEKELVDARERVEQLTNETAKLRHTKAQLDEVRRLLRSRSATARHLLKLVLTKRRKRGEPADGRITRRSEGPLSREPVQTDALSVQRVFQEAYSRNLWGEAETVSGPGSGLARTASFRAEIPALLRELGARSLLDAGCGDLHWMKEVELPIDTYIGMDIVPELVASNQERHGGTQKRFVHGDIVRDDLPRVDVILCRDCLVHLNLADASAALRNFWRSRSRYLLATTFVDLQTNVDVETGGWRRLNLERDPFSLPAPERMIDERCVKPGATDKRLGLWRLLA
jgi:SAM-dependent methyltransferase